MKCPDCGKWNRAGMPHCVYCGAELPDDAYGTDGIPAWQLELKDKDKPKSYIRVDDRGETETSDDPRDRLASEMVDLKSRKIAGEQEQRRLREAAAARGMAPSGRTVHTTSNRSTFFSAYNDNPDSTLRPVDPEMVEEGDVRPDAKRVYPARYRAEPNHRDEDDVYGYGNTRRIVNIQKPDDDEPVYDGYHDTSEYLPAYARQDEYENSLRMRNMQNSHKARRVSWRKSLRTVAIMASIALFLWLGITFVLPMIQNNQKTDARAATVTPTIRDDLAAHTITIPGTDGQRITIKELRTSAIVTGGIATFDILDHIWYDDYEDYLQETLSVTVSPFVVSDSGRQTALDPITYDIDIPLSPIDLQNPDSPYQVVSTALYNIILNVREGSTLTINGEDYSDLVNTEGGRVSYNATVQPIGENVYTIVVRSQYCRENTMTVTLYREKQDIPLDLASDIASSSTDSSQSMLVRATTLPGAVVKVLSPYTDLDITNIASDGSFSFQAVFDKIGTNVITITADYPGKSTTTVQHEVYYVPNVDVYSRKAWDIVEKYTDLMDNIDKRKAESRIYICKGVITSIETTKPQRAFMNVGTEESPILIYVENSSKTTWEEGASYRLFGDAYGMYDSKPWLVVRYTYGLNEVA
ncbi:MAG: hypothetical protein PHI98_09050 [Eubacteriales bacterium]|nr:hypothetical protein [Eubacteriales bacterium]